ncbi:metalloregulator ArsR/SmtB family transcription factor [Oscillochloris sp. ZM17-4]|uniref:ArsR/SmtB family transcription factor n=1 Tax=Oscillochloris sp. ZM17-4 TaxID=2866714 RepID=UPI001C73CB5C|nr:metalloregulator ArsR/SmtB family transcription factor [Oscillochloris sp. ZM17-4]MBX0329726.1 metalloregulator ArsR/SmtB family transcription factor [Oscillochloris sp. ZM17-4]
MIELTETTEDRAAGCCNPGLAPRIGPDEARELSDDLSILANPIRLQILDMLAQRDGHVCVCDLEVALPVKQPTVSHHLRLLRAAGMIDCERRGLWVYYFVQRESLADLRARMLDRFDALAYSTEQHD